MDKTLVLLFVDKDIGGRPFLYTSSAMPCRGSRDSLILPGQTDTCLSQTWAQASNAGQMEICRPITLHCTIIVQLNCIRK